jgi:hypothetical protein
MSTLGIVIGLIVLVPGLVAPFTPSKPPKKTPE